MHLLICFDGLTEPNNPGGTGCYGFSIRGLGGPLDVIPGCGVIGDMGTPMTNNIAEYIALGKALAYLTANAKERITPETELHIVGDSKLVIEQVNGSWKCEAPHLQRLRDLVRERLKQLGCKYKLEWIPREQNVEVDQLSRAAYIGRTGLAIPERAKEAKT